VKSTRSQPAAPQFCTEYPAAGVAETKEAESDVRDRTTTPPPVSYRESFPAPLDEGDPEADTDGEVVWLDVMGAPPRPSAVCIGGEGTAEGEGTSGVTVGLAPPAARTAGGVSAAGISTESTPSQATPPAAAVAANHAATADADHRPERDTTRLTSSLPLGRAIGCQTMANVLLVEDDPDVRSAVIHQLTGFGHAVRSAGTALAALREASRDPGDIIVLDLGLPDLDGSETLKMLRAVTQVPVIIATARDDEAEIIKLLNAGADDYLVKPFSGGHLAARIAALLRRTGSGQAPSILRVGGLEVDPRRREASLDGRALDLSRREFDLLAYLAARPGEVVTRRELLTEVWQLPYGDDQTIDVHLSWLRRKLGEKASAPRYLHTVRGVGVRLNAPPGQ
jgi:DNA-binding response OmpR family regulator